MPQLDKIDEELLFSYVKEYTDKHGVEALKDIYRLHRKISNCNNQIKDFPISYIYRRLLFNEIENGEYTGVPLAQVAAREGITTRKVYRLLHSFLNKTKTTKRINKTTHQFQTQ